MVPLRAASREKGAALPPILKDGGSTREKGPAVRLRLERMPERFPLVGERPAGADMGDDLEMAVLSLVAGDLGWRVRRGVAVAVIDGVKAEKGAGLGEAALRT